MSTKYFAFLDFIPHPWQKRVEKLDSVHHYIG